MITGPVDGPSDSSRRFDRDLLSSSGADNLTALRELDLRFLADETEERLLEYLRAHQKDVVWDPRTHPGRGDDGSEQVVVGSSHRSRWQEMWAGVSAL